MGRRRDPALAPDPRRRHRRRAGQCVTSRPRHCAPSAATSRGHPPASPTQARGLTRAGFPIGPTRGVGHRRRRRPPPLGHPAVGQVLATPSPLRSPPPRPSLPAAVPRPQTCRAAAHPSLARLPPPMAPSTNAALSSRAFPT
jgi:hypothetical protein